MGSVSGALGGGSGGLVLLEEANGPFASTTFADISQDYEHLRIIMRLRSDYAAAEMNPALQINDDVGATSYYGQQLTSDAGTTSSTYLPPANKCVITGVVPANTALANSFGVVIVDIPFYSDTGQHKIVLSESFHTHSTASGGPMIAKMNTVRVTNTDPVTKLLISDVGLASGSPLANMVAGSKVRLYGIPVA